MDFVSPEGSSHSNLHTQPQLVWRHSAKLSMGLEYIYWRNKIGRAEINASVMQALLRFTF